MITIAECMDMPCRSCGNEINLELVIRTPDGRIFCYHCGVEIEQDE